jgi:MoaA/NifB/PqqE/SkfB family radical SAM enzyme
MDNHSGTQRTTSHEPLAVKLSSTRDSQYFYVNWWLTDHCNWDCSYCHDILKRGDLPFPKLDHVKDFIDQISAFCRRINKKIFLDITGGEVTEYPFLDELLLHARSHDSYIKIRTNASQTVDNLCKTLDLVDVVEIEFHPEHTQTSHFMMCLNAAAQKQGLLVSVNLNALPERFHEVEELEHRIREKWANFNVKLKMLFNDPVSNTKPMIYQEPQKVKLKRQSGSMILDYGDDQEFTDYQTLILEDKNRFEDWSCNIGIEQIIVDAYGVVRRGHCRQGGSIGSLGNPLRLDGLTVTCKKSHCVNGFDILATKIKSV